MNRTQAGFPGGAAATIEWKLCSMLLWIGLALSPGWGCATTNPPESSLPGSQVVADSSLSDRIAEQTAGTEVPEPPWPTEGQRTLPEPDATSGAGTLLIYTAITGHTPFDMDESSSDHWSRGGPNLQGGALDREIEEELRRRQEALDRRSADTSDRATIDSLITGEHLAERANPRIAPRAPANSVSRDSLTVEPVAIVAGSWGNTETLEVDRGFQDDNGDGVPERILFFGTGTDTLLRLEEDSNGDGHVDTWQSYEGGELTRRLRDTDADGAVDVWEEYRDARMIGRTLDRDHDDVADTFFEYRGDALAEERHDSDNDGRIDQLVRYENLFRISSEVDQDRDGATDTWITYGISRGEEVVVRVERSSRGAGPADIFETYDTTTGKSILSKREEDSDGDGSIDVTSLYEDGKLVQREVTHSEAQPL
ncbi:MAG: hypothetical protein AAEJ52_23115 [Myxococcota bacterium]